MQQEIKNLRVKIDGLAQLTKELKGYNCPIEMFVAENTSSDEVRKATDSLYLAKAWLGKILGELGTENPYGSGYKTKEDIVPTQDVSKPGLTGEIFTLYFNKDFINKELDKTNYNDFNHIEEIDFLRTEIQKLLSVDVLCICNNLMNVSRKLPEADLNHSSNRIDLSINLVYKYLSEARFWLGFELERIKNSN